MVNGFLYYAGGSMGYDMPEVDYEEYWQAGGHDALAVRGPLHVSAVDSAASERQRDILLGYRE